MSGRPSLAGIVRALGGDLYAGGRRANVPGPGHSRSDRSVSLLLEGGRVLAHSFAGDDWREVLADLRRRRLVDAAGALADGAAVGPGVPAPSRRARLAMAQRLWSEARPIAGSLSELYLHRRGLAAASEALRHHPGVAAAAYAERGLRRPAMLAAISAPDGRITALELVYLAPNGGPARMALPRKTLGLRTPGDAVRLDPPATEMLVGEGVATCLSAARRFGLPAWAPLSTGNLRAWRPPPGVAFVVIAADRGRDGERSALVLARALRGRGVHGAIRWPPRPFGDWNEALCAGLEAEEGQGGWARRTDGPGRRPGVPAMTHDDGLVLIPDGLRPVLIANGAHDGDHVPVLKLFNPAGAGTWLITELGDDGDTLFGLCDLEMGFPELGSVSLGEITAVKLPLGLTIERDVAFEGRVPISRWMEIARRTGSIRAAEAVVRELPVINGAATS
jgi:hypothetical protein